MKSNNSLDFQILPSVSTAIRSNTPVAALETAVLTHGLPHPANVQLSIDLEKEVNDQGAVPATIGILDGRVHIGLSKAEIERLGEINPETRKISRRDFGIAAAKKLNGGTTVAGTMIAAHAAGIRVFATGGIGGVHRNAPFDISPDLQELGRTPMIVICSGAKSILDLPATLEVLETNGVPILGYQTDEFPAFFSRESGLKVNARVDNPQEVIQTATAQWKMGISSAVLVVVPPPAGAAIPHEEIEILVDQAVEEAETSGISGQALTPFLLSRVNELSRGASLKANLALLKNNARTAAQIAKELAGYYRSQALNRSI